MVRQVEMQPGDSLVDKIFEEGIKNAAAVIVILSQISVTKKWVREELNASFVERINGKSKLIPVVIEECNIPMALQSTLFQRIDDLTSYEGELNRIVRAIFGTSEKPALGSAPYYAQVSVVQIGDLTDQDSQVLKLVGDHYLEKRGALFYANLLYAAAHSIGLDWEAVSDSAEILDRRGYIESMNAARGGIVALRMKHYGFQEYAMACVHGYEETYKDVIVQIVNFRQTNSLAIAETLCVEEQLVIGILYDLSEKALIDLRAYVNGTEFRIASFSVELKRMLQ